MARPVDGSRTEKDAPAYRGFRIQVDAVVAEDERYNADVRLRRLLSAEKPCPTTGAGRHAMGASLDRLP